MRVFNLCVFLFFLDDKNYSFLLRKNRGFRKDFSVFCKKINGIYEIRNYDEV